MQHQVTPAPLPATLPKRYMTVTGALSATAPATPATRVERPLNSRMGYFAETVIDSVDAPQNYGASTVPQNWGAKNVR
jgi:hypothetical protein